MEVDSSTEVTEVSSAVKRAAEWDSDPQCAKVARLVCH